MLPVLVFLLPVANGLSARLRAPVSVAPEPLAPFNATDLPTYLHQMYDGSYVASGSNEFKQDSKTKARMIFEGKVVHHQAGSFVSADCPNGPDVIVGLVGEYRTFGWAHQSLVDSLERSVGQCYHVVLTTKHQFYAASAHGGECPGGGTSCVSKYPNDAEGMLSQLKDDSEDFGGRLSYVVIEEHMGSQIFNRGSVYFWTTWALTRWAAKTQGFTLQPHTPVLMARPDMGFLNAYDFKKVGAYFKASGDRRTKFGQVVDPDMINMYSLAAFDWNIGYTIDTGFRYYLAEKEERANEDPRTTPAGRLTYEAVARANLISPPNDMCLDEDRADNLFDMTGCKFVSNGMVMVQSALQNSCLCRVADPGMCKSQQPCIFFQNYHDERYKCNEPEYCIGNNESSIEKFDLTKNVVHSYFVGTRNGGEALIDFDAPRGIKVTLSEPFDLA